MDNSDHKFDVFLSYNSNDRAAVQRVRELLRTHGVKTFFDQENLNLGEPWITEIENALRNVHAVAVFIGEFNLGPIQKIEANVALIRKAQSEAAGAKYPVIPVLLPRADAEKVGDFLKLNTHVDLRGGIDDPVAIEALARVMCEGYLSCVPLASGYGVSGRCRPASRALRNCISTRAARGARA